MQRRRSTEVGAHRSTHSSAGRAVRAPWGRRLGAVAVAAAVLAAPTSTLAEGQRASTAGNVSSRIEAAERKSETLKRRQEINRMRELAERAQERADTVAFLTAIKEAEDEKAAAELAAAQRAEFDRAVAARDAAEKAAAEKAAAEQQAAERAAQPVAAAPAPPVANGSVWDQLAQCESNGNWAINTGNGYYGGLQFSASSWQAVGGTGLPHQHSRETQIAMAERLKAQQGWGAWPACSSKLGLR